MSVIEKNLNLEQQCIELVQQLEDERALHIALREEYETLFFHYKALLLETSRVESEQGTPEPQLGDAWSETIPELPYINPVDIQEPLPYIYESQ